MSAENNEHNTQEQELWDRMSTTDGRERAEVLDELSHIAATKLIDIDATPFSMGMDQLNIGMVLEKLDRHEEAVLASNCCAQI